MEVDATWKEQRAAGSRFAAAALSAIVATAALLFSINVLLLALFSSLELGDFEYLRRIETSRLEGAIATLPAFASVVAAWVIRQWGAGAPEEWILRVPAVASLAGSGVDSVAFARVGILCW